MSEDRFFSRANVHRAGWSVLLALVAFVAGSVFSLFRGKEKVVIATPEEGGKPLVVRIEGSPGQQDLQTRATIEELRREIRRLREGQVGSKRRAVSGTDARRTNASTLSPPFVPAFELPANVEGYTSTGLSGFGEASCPPDVVGKGDVVMLQLFLEQRVNPKDLSPAYLRIDRPEDEKNTVQIVEQQYVLAAGVNSFRVPIDLPAGDYQLGLGFYSRAELSKKYPNFYSVQCKLRVQ